MTSIASLARIGDTLRRVLVYVRGALRESLTRMAKGLVLIPVGTTVGTYIMVAAKPDQGESPIIWAFASVLFMWPFVPFGLIFGAGPAVLVTCVWLPLLRGPRAWGGWGMRVWMTLCGAGAGMLMAYQALRDPHDAYMYQDFHARFVLTALTVVPGAVCGYLFALWTGPKRGVPLAVPAPILEP